MQACLELHGITNARAAAAGLSSASAPAKAGNANGNPLAQEWSALETLAEASRQVDLNENSRTPATADASSATDATPASQVASFEVEEQFTLDNPPLNYNGRSPVMAKRGDILMVNLTSGEHEPLPPVAGAAAEELSTEERLQALLPSSNGSAEPSNISVAAAAAARLNPSFLDPQLVSNEVSASLSATAADAVSQAGAVASSDPNVTTAEAAAVAAAAAQPWGEMTYMAAAPAMPILGDAQPPPAPANRGGDRMDTSDTLLLNGRPRHSRSRFTPSRRKEVQEVRKIGACIRCRILRKNCGKGNPCDTCRKVLSPRVWRTGCVRTRLHEQLDVYSAGVQVVLSQNRINLLKDQLELANDASVIEVTHFVDSGKMIMLGTLDALLEPSEAQAAERKSKEPFRQAIMIDQDVEDVPGRIEIYMRDVLPLFIAKEPSNFMRVTLETAMQQQAIEENELLRKALELWGLVESIDRERQWSILERPSATGVQPRWIKEAQNANDADIYTMICMQLNAAAERKANSTSKALLNHMDRLLTDSKTKVGFKMFLTAVIFLNCVEKSTWAFKAWEQDHLRPGWPLERDPSVFARQGGNLASLLKMLLAIRKALPQTMKDANGKLSTKDKDPIVVDYFQRLDLECKCFFYRIFCNDSMANE